MTDVALFYVTQGEYDRARELVTERRLAVTDQARLSAQVAWFTLLAGIYKRGGARGFAPGRFNLGLQKVELVVGDPPPRVVLH